MEDQARRTTKEPRDQSKAWLPWNHRSFHMGPQCFMAHRPSWFPWPLWSLATRTPWFQAAMRNKATKDHELPWDRGRNGINVSSRQSNLGDRCPSLGLPPSSRADPGAPTTLKSWRHDGHETLKSWRHDGHETLVAEIPIMARDQAADVIEAPSCPRRLAAMLIRSRWHLDHKAIEPDEEAGPVGNKGAWSQGARGPIAPRDRIIKGPCRPMAPATNVPSRQGLKAACDL